MYTTRLGAPPSLVEGTAPFSAAARASSSAAAAAPAAAAAADVGAAAFLAFATVTALDAFLTTACGRDWTVFLRDGIENGWELLRGCGPPTRDDSQTKV
jgi:hypothetical protein